MLTKIAIIWIAFAAVVGFAAGGSLVSGPPFLHVTVDQGKSHHENAGSDQQPPDERHQATEESMAYYTKWLMLFTAAMAVATIVLGFATAGLYISGRDTAQRQLRAYVHIDSGAIIFIPDNGFEWHIKIKNFGLTPAHNVRHWTHCWIATYPLNEILPRPGSDFKTSVSVIAPGNHEELVEKRDHPIPVQALPLIGTPQGTIYIYGEIRYVDAFGKDRGTRYRFFHRGEADGFQRLKPDTEGNEAT